MHRSCCGCIIRFDKDANKFRAEKFFLLLDPDPAENPAFTLNAEDLINRVFRSRWVSLPVAALFFLSGRCVNADPVGDFFKKVGHSVSKAFQPRPTPNPTEKKTKRAFASPEFATIKCLPRRRRLHSNSQQTSLKKKRLLPLSPSCALQLSLQKKQKEICRMEFRYQVIKAWSPVLIHPREITSTSAPLRQDPP